MIRIAGAVIALMLLASCPRLDRGPTMLAAPDLETAAIVRGLVRDPADSDLVGLYGRDTDRVCIVRRGDGYRIGGFVDYGDGIGCNGAGQVTRSSGGLRIDFGGGCGFSARFDGDRITFPPDLPTACARLCGRRASFGALDVSRLSETAAEAVTMRDARGGTPCADDQGTSG